jgi:hypothetical protein
MLLGAAVLLLIALLFFIVFSERGSPAQPVEKRADRIKEHNQQLTQENPRLGVEIDRRMTPTTSSVARKEFGRSGHR